MSYFDGVLYYNIFKKVKIIKNYVKIKQNRRNN